MRKCWKPKNTRVFILALGLAEWENPQDPIGHRDAVLYDFFRLAGVPKKHILHLRDAGGDSESIYKVLPDFLADSDEKTDFFFYYAGHGLSAQNDYYPHDLCFVHPDPEVYSFTLSDLVNVIEENFNGYRALLFADCCHSGRIARFAAESASEYHYAGLASTSADELSTENWTFTDCLLEGLRGMAHTDIDADGAVSWLDLAKYVQTQMLLLENQSVDFGFGVGFDAQTSLALVK